MKKVYKAAQAGVKSEAYRSWNFRTTGWTQRIQRKHNRNKYSR